jgi:hypothetical protein
MFFKKFPIVSVAIAYIGELFRGFLISLLRSGGLV